MNKTSRKKEAKLIFEKKKNIRWRKEKKTKKILKQTLEQPSQKTC
jgi:hypothetical protein